MSLAPGRRLGAYEVLGLIGAGGMGEVYRARDTRLDRIVAIKILPEKKATAPGFKERFEREARAVSSLEHPNICAVYDVGEHDGVSFLVMQHLEGETLEARLQKGPLPTKEALQYAIELADALDKAHSRGVIHRDLKPGNIMLTKSGAKLLDFGLAKPGGIRVAGELSMLSTTPPNLTAQGAILGTFHYMAPEQLEGAEVDARSDIFSFGVVLYEMLSGRRPFEGKSQASLIAAILDHEPAPVFVDRPSVPRFIDHIIRRCLAKNPDDRWQSARDICNELRWVGRDEVQAHGASEERTGHKTLRRALPWALAASAIAIAALAVLYMRESVPAREMRLNVATPAASNLTAFALSPDGERLVAAVSTEGQRRLWVRSISSGTWQPLNGTEGAYTPFWSPDSRAVGFIAGNKLKRIDIEGGAPQTLTDATPRGGSWNRDGVIVFAPDVLGPLARIDARGGEPVLVTKLEPLQTAHTSPVFLPDGRQFLYYSAGPLNTRGVHLASVDAFGPKRLISSDGPPVYVAPGWLLFTRQGVLRARRFDSEKGEMSGDEVTVANSVSGAVSAAATGLIAYRTASTRQTQLVWADRTGKQVGTFGPTPPPINNLSAPRLSPDGSRVAMFGGEYGDVYLVDQTRVTRFTFDAAGDRYPIWSPDGQRVVFDSTRQKGRHLFQSSGPGGEELLLDTPQFKTANDWSPDGRFLLFQSNDPKTGIDLWVLPLEGNRQPYIFLRTTFNERRASFSPNGRWVTYLSNESGRYEVYVRPFFEPGVSSLPKSGGGASSDRWLASTTGGIQPRWSRDGKELYYLGPDGKLMAVPIKDTGATLEMGVPVALFTVRIVGVESVDDGLQYDVSRDGRFLLNNLSDDTSPITVIVNWTPPAN